MSLCQIEHGSCAIHTLQLVINDGLFTQRFFNDILKNCRKIVGHFSHSPTASDILADIQNQLGLPQKKLVQDVQTCWNSTFYMLQSVFEQKNALAQYAADHDIPQLSSQNWILVEKVIKLLEPCEQLTKDLSKDDSTISMVIPGYNVLRQTLLCADDRGVQTIKQSLLESLDSRFIPYTTNVMYAAATILDPRFKTQFVNQSMLRHAREFIESKMNLQDQPVQAQVDSSSPVPAKKSMWDFLNDADSNEPENSIAVPTEFDSYLTKKNCPILQML